jgi:iron complex outermembrane receptor protein
MNFKRILVFHTVLFLVVVVTGATALAQSEWSLSGTVVDESGAAIEGASVSLFRSEGEKERTTVTDFTGGFWVSGIAAGHYTIRAHHVGFKDNEAPVEVSDSSSQASVRITLAVASVRQSITVSDAAEYSVPDATGATKTDTPIMETPVSVQVIPQQMLQDQKTVHLIDAIQNVSGVISSNDSYGTEDSFTIRGFDQAELTFEDGLRLNQYATAGFSVDFANIERVEIAKGPASVLYGQGEPGGLVNIVTKKPLNDSHYTLEQQFGSHGLYQTIADATGPLSRTFFYRFILNYQNFGSFRDFIHSNRLAFFPSITWKPNEQNQFIVQFNYQTGGDVLDNGTPLIFNGTYAVPAQIPISRNLVDPNTNYEPDHQLALKILGNHDFRKNWRLRVAYKSEYHNLDSPTLLQYYAGDADSGGNLHRFGFTSPTFRQWTHEVVTDLLGSFETFGMKNSVLIGFDDYYQAGHYTANFFNPPSINIYNPIYNQPFAPPDPANLVYVANGQHAYGLYVQDQIKLPAHFFLLAGLRFDRVTSFDTGGSANAPPPVYDKPSPTPRGGLLWQPVQQVSFYVSYAGNYGATPLGSLTPNGKTLPPEADHQYEFGVKTEWFHQRLSATSSIYQITKENVPSADPANPLYTIAIGKARSRGYELDVAGRITQNWQIIGGFSYIHALVTADTNSPSLAGLRFPGIPYDSGSLWTVYEVPRSRLKGLKLGVGALGRTRELAWEAPANETASSCPLNTTFPPGCYIGDRIPGFAIVNAMTGYTWNFEKFRLVGQLNFNNLLNKTYFANINPSQALAGVPFTVVSSMRMEF